MHGTSKILCLLTTDIWILNPLLAKCINFQFSNDTPKRYFYFALLCFINNMSSSSPCSSAFCLGPLDFEALEASKLEKNHKYYMDTIGNWTMAYKKLLTYTKTHLSPQSMNWWVTKIFKAIKIKVIAQSSPKIYAGC